MGKREEIILDSENENINDNLISNNVDSVFSETEYREYPQRFLALVGYLLVSIAYFFTNQVFSPISAQVSDIYGVPPIVVNMNSLVQNILFLPLTLPVGVILEKYGMRVSVYIASALCIIGVWMRILVNTNYYYTLFAHIILGIGFPFTQNIITKFSLVWFRTEKRQMITQILMVTAMISVLLSSLLPGMWMKDYNEEDDKLDNYSQGKDSVKSLMMVQAIVATILAAVGAILMREKPPTPPSFTAEQKREDMKPSIKKLLKNKNYIITLFSYGIFCGNFLATGVIMSFTFKPYGFGPETTSFAGIGMVVAGIIGSGISGKIFRTKPKFRLFIVIGVMGSIIGYGLTLVVLPIENKYLVLLPYLLIGFVSLQAFPIFLELASELAYPVPETVSSGLLQGGSSLLGFAFGNMYSLMLDGESKTMVMVVQTVNMALFAICIFIVKFLKVVLNRTKEDAKHEKGLKIVEQNNEDGTIISSDSSDPTLNSNSNNNSERFNS